MLDDEFYLWLELISVHRKAIELRPPSNAELIPLAVDAHKRACETVVREGYEETSESHELRRNRARTAVLLCELRADTLSPESRDFAYSLFASANTTLTP